MSCHVMSCHVMFFSVLDVMLCHVMSCYVILLTVALCIAMVCDVNEMFMFVGDAGFLVISHCRRLSLEIYRCPLHHFDNSTPHMHLACNQKTDSFPCD